MSEERKVLVDRLDEDELRNIRNSSIAENEELAIQARQEIRDIVGNDLVEVKGDIHDFTKLAEKEGCTVADINQRLARANAVFAECNKINTQKARSQGWEQTANGGIVGTEDAWAAEMQGQAPSRMLFKAMEEDMGMPKLDNFLVHREFKSETGNIGGIIAATMVRSGGTGNTPTGITPNRPQNILEPFQVVDKRRSVVEVLPRFPVSNDTFKYLREPITAASANADPAYQVAEDAAAVTQDVGVIEETVTIRKTAAMVSISREQLKDVPYARPYASMILARQALDNTEKQVLQGDGSGENLNGFFNVSGSLSKARPASSGIVGNAAYQPTLEFWADALADYGKKRATSGGGAGTYPTHAVMSSDHYFHLMKQKGSDGHFLYGDPVTGAVNSLWGIQVIINDFLPSDSALLFNNDSRYVLMITREGYELETGLNGVDFQHNRVSMRLTHRCAIAFPNPVTVMKLTNMDGSA